MKFSIEKVDFRQVFITLLHNTYRADEFETVTLGSALDDIKTGAFAKQVRRVREIYQRQGKGPEYSKAKAGLASLVFGGTFHGAVRNANLERHSLIFPFDIDKVNVDATRKALIDDEHVLFLFDSPSQDGIKGGIPIIGDIKNDADHKRAFSQIERYLRDRHGIRIDPACKDVRRLCFVSHDPDLYFNPDAKPFQIADAPPEQPKKRVKVVRHYDPGSHIPDNLGRKKLEWACRRIINAPDGEIHNTQLRTARLVGGWVAGGWIDFNTAHTALFGALDAAGRGEERKSIKTIDDGLRYGIDAPISPDEETREWQRRKAEKRKERRAIKAFERWKQQYKCQLCKRYKQDALDDEAFQHLKTLLSGSESDRIKLYREVSNER